jgi:hypothetical protein
MILHNYNIKRIKNLFIFKYAFRNATNNASKMENWLNLNCN